jgi:hypothetical protein
MIYLAVDKTLELKDLKQYLEDSTRVDNMDVFDYLARFGFNNHDAFTDFDSANRFCELMFAENGHVLEVTREGMFEEGFYSRNF